MCCFNTRLKKKLVVCQTMLRMIELAVFFGIYFRTVSGGKVPRQVEPKFLQTPTNVTVHKGELAELVCHIKNLGPKLVVWRKYSSETPLTIGTTVFSPSSDISVDNEKLSNKQTKWNLLIKNVQMKHAGVYECQISATGIYTHYVALNVIDEPLRREPQMTITGTEYVNTFSDIRITCNATGHDRAPSQIDWFFNGNRIHISDPRWYGRTEILREQPVPGPSFISHLVIHRSVMEDQGNYVCRSTDLKVNSMKVHILNADKENAIVARAPGEEIQQGDRIEGIGSESASSSSSSSCAKKPFRAKQTLLTDLLLIFLALLLACR